MKITVTLLAIAFLAAGSALAGSITLSPAVVMLAGDAGQSTTQTLTITNGTSQRLVFELVARDVVVESAARRMREAGEVEGSIAASAVFSTPRIELEPGDTARVDATVTIPARTQHRAVAIVFQGTDRIMNGGVSVVAAVGTLLTFSLPGERSIELETLEIVPQSGSTNLRVAQACRNDGTEPGVLKGMVAVLDAAGHLVARFPLEPRRLLPGERTELAAEYSGELQPGSYRIIVSYEFDGVVETAQGEASIS